ncbi:MAG: gamma-glutamyl-gamma-aminobutyrate hydrolase family protein [Halofilum sp. (in: g-proteobacteria)]|nr:gamma-glutamyl-gamma-aminobutyrate hydrolase family protein [Halofilum sp. (in: g-proteobacteria)]
MARPLIGVTGPDRGGSGPWLLVRHLLRRQGADVLRLTPGRPRPSVAPDGLVVTGGHDIEPVLYAAAPEVRPRYDQARDALESAMIDQALAAGRPILGICRGAQLLNVRLGGSLRQDLRPVRRVTSNRRTILPLKTLEIEPGSYLGRIVRGDRIRINSLHNQAIDRLGRGLQVVGRDLDGIVQAVEDPEHPFRIGVQWHPEFLPYIGRQRALFRALVAAAAATRDTAPA